MIKITFVFSVFAAIILFSTTNVDAANAEEIQWIILNPDSPRDLVVRAYPDVQKFDPKSGKLDFSIQFGIDDDRTKEPFQAWVRTPVYTGGYDFSEKGNQGGFYEVWERPQWNNHAVKPTYPMNLWPIETFTVPVYLLIDDNVSVQTERSIKVSTGDMINNEEWSFVMIPREGSKTELDKLAPTTNYYDNEVISVFKYDLVISRTQGYVFDHVMFVIVPIPLIGMMLIHSKFYKRRQISTNRGIFSFEAGILFSTYITLKTQSPIGFTVVDAIYIGGVVLCISLYYKIITNKITRKNSIVAADA